MRPGREHDLSAARTDSDLLARIADWITDGAPALADLGYEGEPETFTIPFKKPRDGQLTIDQQAYNALHGALRCLGERANSPALLQDHLQGPAPLPRLSLAPR